jgi:HKD family nuclease
MSITAQVLFGSPHEQLDAVLERHLAKCHSVQIISGFATVEGIRWLLPMLGSHPGKLQKLIIGAGTQRAFDALDTLLDSGVDGSRLRIHLGHCRNSGGKKPFYQYHPMLHSKVYLFDMGIGHSVAIIGSHNLTGFAMTGLNGEAAVEVQGDSKHPEICKVLDHISRCSDESVEYSASNKESYVWWMEQFLAGVQLKLYDRPREIEDKKTVIILCQASKTHRPKKDETVYFELPQEFRQRALKAEVHLYAFDILPRTPSEALASLEDACFSTWGKLSGLSDERKVKAISAPWIVTSAMPPRMERSFAEYKPPADTKTQQAWMKAAYSVQRQYVYYFTLPPRWVPGYDMKNPVQATPRYAEFVRDLNLIPPEHSPYFRVTSLDPDSRDAEENRWFSMYAAPESGSFVLLSPRRAVLT